MFHCKWLLNKTLACGHSDTLGRHSAIALTSPDLPILATSQSQRGLNPRLSPSLRIGTSESRARGRHLWQAMPAAKRSPGKIFHD
jgi:hypothetical protein